MAEKQWSRSLAAVSLRSGTRPSWREKNEAPRLHAPQPVPLETASTVALGGPASNGRTTSVTGLQRSAPRAATTESGEQPKAATSPKTSPGRRFEVGGPDAGLSAAGPPRAPMWGKGHLAPRPCLHRRTCDPGIPASSDASPPGPVLRPSCPLTCFVGCWLVVRTPDLAVDAFSCKSTRKGS